MPCATTINRPHLFVSVHCLFKAIQPILIHLVCGLAFPSPSCLEHSFSSSAPRSLCRSLERVDSFLDDALRQSSLSAEGHSGDYIQFGVVFFQVIVCHQWNNSCQFERNLLAEAKLPKKQCSG